jgi:predicted Zn-dependent protease
MPKNHSSTGRVSDPIFVLLAAAQPCYVRFIFLRSGKTLNRRNLCFTCGSAIVSLIFFSCSSVRIPSVSDYRLERQVADEAAPILRVTEDRDEAPSYRIRLADFPRQDILGMSVGGRRIYINATLARRAFTEPAYRWMLRQILAHEIAHEVARHADGGGVAAFNRAAQGDRGVTATDIGLPPDVRFQNYPVENELEADLNGMSYWKTLGWDCRIWVNLLKAFIALDYAGDIYHPTDERLRQALSACPAGR